MTATPHLASKPKQTRLPPAQRQAQLLDACLAVVSAEGFHGVTIERIADACGISRTVIYQQFGGLEAMLLALVDREADACLADVADASAEPIVDEASFIAVSTAGRETILRRPDGWRMLLAPPTGVPPEVYARLAEIRQQIRGFLVESINVLRPSASSHEVNLAAALFQVANEEGARLILEQPPLYTVEEVVKRDAAVFWALMQTLP